MYNWIQFKSKSFSGSIKPDHMGDQRQEKGDQSHWRIRLFQYRKENLYKIYSAGNASV